MYEKVDGEDFLLLNQACEELMGLSVDKKMITDPIHVKNLTVFEKFVTDFIKEKKVNQTWICLAK